MMRRCDFCGATYEARRSTSRYCSDACRKRRHKAVAYGGRLAPVKAVPAPVSADDVAMIASEARYLADSLVNASACAPEALRPTCARLAAALVAALDGEGL